MAPIDTPDDQPFRVVFADQEASDWREKLRRTRVFLALVTPDYLQTPELWDHVAYARLLGKPIRIALQRGTVLPKGFIGDASDVQIYEWETQQELNAYVLQVSQDSREEA